MAKTWILTDEVGIPEIGEWYMWANNTITKRMPEETGWHGEAVRIVKAYDDDPLELIMEVWKTYKDENGDIDRDSWHESLIGIFWQAIKKSAEQK